MGKHCNLLMHYFLVLLIFPVQTKIIGGLQWKLILFCSFLWKLSGGSEINDTGLASLTSSSRSYLQPSMIYLQHHRRTNDRKSNKTGSLRLRCCSMQNVFPLLDATCQHQENMFDVAAIVNQDTTILFIMYNEIFVLIFLFHTVFSSDFRDESPLQFRQRQLAQQFE